MKNIPTVTVKLEEFLDEDNFKEPSRWFILDAMGDRVYYKTSDRLKAQQQADKEYDGKYTIRTNKTTKPKGSVTVKSSLNSFSRKGMKTRGI